MSGDNFLTSRDPPALLSANIYKKDIHSCQTTTPKQKDISIQNMNIVNAFPDRSQSHNILVTLSTLSSKRWLS